VRLARIGFDRVRGAVVDVESVLVDHPHLAATATRLAAADLGSWRAETPELQLVDVRNPVELEAGIIEGARLVPLPRLLDRLGQLDQDAPTVVYCASGVRSAIAASLLRSRGFRRVADLRGGYDAWQAARFPTIPAVPAGLCR
jgi:rhodanese-related sulfurtransferase